MDNYRDALLKAALNARIKLTEEEISLMMPQLENVLKAFNKMDETDTGKTEPTIQVITQIKELRQDKPEEKNFDGFSNTKAIKNKKFIGPKLVD